MKKLLAVCAFLALCGAAMAYDVTTSFKGTVDVKFNWVNFSGNDEDYQNCNDWVNFPVKYDAYLVLCYDRILCPVCPFEIEYAYLWLVDKKNKQVFFASLDNDGIENIEGFCFGNGNVGVSIDTFLPYPDLEDFVEESVYTTTLPIKFVLTGTREKFSSKAYSNILTLNGGIALSDVGYADTTAFEFECDDASEMLFATVSFKKDSTKVKADPYCPECATNCETVALATMEKVAKSNKKSIWWSILGEQDVEIFAE